MMRDPKSSYSRPNPKRTSRDWGWDVIRNRFITKKSPQTNLISSCSKVIVSEATERKKTQIHNIMTSNKVFDIISHYNPTREF